MSFKVIYMTGAPAAGKSTVCRSLLGLRSDVKIFEYGKEMAAYLRSLTGPGGSVSQDTLRGGTSEFVGQDHIENVDHLSFEFAARWRTECHVIIDSHHVTKETFGFRISPFTAEKLERLRPTEIWILYVTSEETRARIAADPQGRPLPTQFEAEFHTFIQTSLAAVYGVVAGVPTLMFDASSENDGLVESLSRRLDQV